MKAAESMMKNWLRLLITEQSIHRCSKVVYIKGDVLRQEYLRVALEWVCKSEADEDIEAYMSRHRHDTDIQELKTYPELFMSI